MKPMRTPLLVLLVACLAGCAGPRDAFKSSPPPQRRVAPPPAAAPTAQPTKSVNLVWDPSPTPGVGYVVSQGGRSGVYTNSTQPSTLLTATIANLVSKSTYFFAVKAVTLDGKESVYSNEISYKVPSGRAKLVTEQTQYLASGNWTAIATNYDETTNNSGFYRIVVTLEE